MSQHRVVPGSSRTKRYGALVVLIAALAAGAYWYFAGSSGQPNTASNPFGRMAGMATPVSTATVQRGQIAFFLKAIGTVTAINTVTVRSRVDGELEKIYFQEGQKVQAGELLAQIDPRTYQVQLDQALGEQKQNEAKLRNAQRDLKRYELLYKQNSLAKQQLDAQKALVAQYLGTLKSDQASVASAKLELGFTRIVAPITGIVGLRQIDPGNLVSASGTDGLVVITQMQPISVLFSLPQAQLPSVLDQIRAGKTLAVDLFDSSDTKKIALGRLVSVDNQIDVATGTVKLRALFSNATQTLFPNEFVNVRLHVSTNDDAIFVPVNAVQQGSIGAFVYTVTDNDKVHVQPITTGTVDNGNITVTNGLAPGQKVVTEGVDRLREGSLVEIIAPNPDAAANGDTGTGNAAGADTATDAPAPSGQ